jgi:large subunit ribosomal protein L30
MAKELIVTQVRSTIGAKARHKRTLKAMGLGRISRSRRLPDNAATRGMIDQVVHLVEVEAVE